MLQQGIRKWGEERRNTRESKGAREIRSQAPAAPQQGKIRGKGWRVNKAAEESADLEREAAMK